MSFFSRCVPCHPRCGHIITAFLLAGILVGCTPSAKNETEVTIEASEWVSFEDVFALEDTLVLDPAVIVGFIWSLDADEQGSVLVVDIQSPLVHAFASTGRHEATFNVATCLLTDDESSQIMYARFLGKDRVMLAKHGRGVAMFDRSGKCVAAKQLPSYARSFCSDGESIFLFHGPSLGRGGDSTTVINVYSMDLDLEEELFVADPQFYWLNTSLGYQGRDMDCFSDGPYYKYLENMDASPVYPSSRVVLSQPEFFVQRDRDVTGEVFSRERQESMDAFQSLNGLYALEEDTRMMLFRGIGEAFRPAGDTGRSVSGMSIVSHTGKFRSVSMALRKEPVTARHGYLYFVGEVVPAGDGDVGNQALIRYRFVPPERADG